MIHVIVKMKHFIRDFIWFKLVTPVDARWKVTASKRTCAICTETSCKGGYGAMGRRSRIETGSAPDYAGSAGGAHRDVVELTIGNCKGMQKERNSSSRGAKPSKWTQCSRGGASCITPLSASWGEDGLGGEPRQHNNSATHPTATRSSTPEFGIHNRTLVLKFASTLTHH